jgi:peptidoglycan/LPS O-acetylase OafA/YrhL
VLVGHVRNLLFVDYTSIAGHANPMLSGAYLLTSLGRHAVMVFFVLSGFLIATVVDAAAASGRWSLSGYAVRRLSRLLVVLVPALLFTAILDRSAVAWLPGAPLYLHPPPGEPVLAYSAAANDAPLVLLGNLAFLQGILVPPFGSNSPLWSLAYEFWYYVAFPLLYFAVVGRGGWPRRITLAGLGVAVLVFAGLTVSLYFTVWLLGAAIALSYRRWGTLVRCPVWLAPAGAVLLIAAFVSGHYLSGLLVRDLAVGVAFTVLLFGLRFRSAERPPAWYAASAAWFAGAAYTVYLVHFPMLLFVRAWLAPSARMQPSLASAMLGLTVLAGVLAVALVFAQFTERRTAAVQAWMERWLVPSRQPPSGRATHVQRIWSVWRRTARRDEA